MKRRFSSHFLADSGGPSLLLGRVQGSAVDRGAHEEGLRDGRVRRAEPEHPGQRGRRQRSLRLLLRLRLRRVKFKHHLASSFTPFFSSPIRWAARNPPPPRRMVHSVASQARDAVDAKLRGEAEEEAKAI